MRQKSDIDVYKIVIYQYDYLDILSNQFSIKCLLLERKMKKFDNAKRGFSKINNK